MTAPVVFGAPYSVYVRAVRLALEEKGVLYRLEAVDIFAEGGPPEGYLARHPFARIPAFEHDGFRLYETNAISLYVDEAFDGPPLMPGDLRRRARAHQIISILDNYAYRTLVWDVFVERVRVPHWGGTPDETKIREALMRARTCLAVVEALMADSAYLAGPQLSLADLRAAAMIAKFRAAPEGAGLLAEHAGLARWWDAMARRPSLAATRAPMDAA
jgi:glutathione S-transferase